MSIHGGNIWEGERDSADGGANDHQTSCQVQQQQWRWWCRQCCWDGAEMVVVVSCQRFASAAKAKHASQTTVFVFSSAPHICCCCFCCYHLATINRVNGGTAITANTVNWLNWMTGLPALLVVHVAPHQFTHTATLMHSQHAIRCTQVANSKIFFEETHINWLAIENAFGEIWFRLSKKIEWSIKLDGDKRIEVKDWCFWRWWW